MSKLRGRLQVQKDEIGLSLVEMVVAIVVFAIVALSAYPLFIKSIQIVSLNNITTTATTTVNELTEKIRKTPTCSNIQSLAATTNIFKDKRNQDYRVVIALPDGCKESESVSFEITATRVSDGKLLVEQQAQVLVPPRNGQFQLG